MGLINRVRAESAKTEVERKGHEKQARVLRGKR